MLGLDKLLEIKLPYWNWLLVIIFMGIGIYSALKWSFYFLMRGVKEER